MNTIERMFKDSSDIKEYAEAYFKYLSSLLAGMDLRGIEAFADFLEKARLDGRTVFFAGNGGSAATASHMANDFGLGTLKKRTRKRPFRVHSLTDNIPVITAIANDDGYDNVFVHQLRMHYREGDHLVAISASGNSPNVVAAVDWVKDKGGTTVAIVGFDGGVLKNKCDIVIDVQTQKGEYGPVEDIHMILDHLITSWINQKLK